MCVTNYEINFLSKGHSTEGSKIPFISKLKKSACVSKQDVIEDVFSATAILGRKLFVEIRYVNSTYLKVASRSTS